MERPAAVIEEMYSAFARGDIAAVLRRLAPQLQWIEAEGFPSAGTYTTPEEVLHKVFMPLAADWHEFSAVPREFVCDANTIVAIGEYSGTSKATNKPFTAPFAHLWKLHGEHVVGFQQFTDTIVVQRALQ